MINASIHALMYIFVVSGSVTGGWTIQVKQAL